jgi:oxazoline/thiazoline dehydrogenase
LLYRLDRLGLLARGLNSGERRLVSCVPLRPPSEPAPQRPPDGPLRLSRRAFARAEGGALLLESPGAWASMTIHDRDLLPLLHDLATGRSAAEIATAAPGPPEKVIEAVLAIMSWCGLLESADDKDWSAHDLLFHGRTRNGYRRVVLGKTHAGREIPAAPAQRSPLDSRHRIVLEAPDPSRLLAEDPPFALVAERRQSVRRQGAVPLTAHQLSEFLFRTLHERGGRRPYPSGGACYPLSAYLAVDRCRGVGPGLYNYEPTLHHLIMVDESTAGLEQLLAEAATAANVERAPQVLLVLAARYARTQRMYGDLTYSLILKEVGAVFQAAMMAAAVIGLGTCPLGCGNSLVFADLVGVDPLIETSVGEMMINSLEEHG